MARTTRIVPVRCLDGTMRAMNIGGAIDLQLAKSDLQGAYLMPRSQRVICQFYSRKDDGKGRPIGRFFREADNDLIAKIAAAFSEDKTSTASVDQLVALLPEYTEE